jgi:hypothetical protein
LTNDPSPIHTIGEYAAELLFPDSEGVVLATFSKVAYLRHVSNEVIWLITEGTPLHRRAIQCAGSLPETSVDTPYTVKNKVLMLESGRSVDFNRTLRWKTPSISPEIALPIKELRKLLDVFIAICESLPTPTGLGIFIPEILALAQDRTISNKARGPDLTPAQKFAWPTLTHIARACLTHDIDGLFLHGEKWIGLGEGLTPSGDDFMGGLFFCIRTLQDLYKPLHPSFFSKLEMFLEESKFRTNLISYTLLKDHAHGHGSETLHAFIHALYTGQDLKTMSLLGSELIQIGHSTGWDILTGILTGMLFVFQ